MVHFRKLLFYLFLLFALSAASVASVLVLASGKGPMIVEFGNNVPKIAVNLDEPIVDPVVGGDVMISVASSSESPENADESNVVDMGAIGEQILASEQAVEESSSYDDELDDLFAESESGALVDPEDETDSDFDFVAVSATRETEGEEDEPIVFDDNDVADLLALDEGVEEDADEEILSDALESRQDVSYAEGFDGGDNWVAFDENAVAEDDGSIANDDSFDSIFSDDEVDETESADETSVNMNETFVVDMNSDEEIVFDANDLSEDQDDEPETVSSEEDAIDDAEFVESAATLDSSDEIVFDENEVVEDEDLDDVFDDDEIAETASDDADSSEEERAVAETGDDLDDFLSALNANDVDDEIIFEDNDVDEEVENAAVATSDESLDDVEESSASTEDVETKKGDSEAKGGKVLFKSKSTTDATNALPNIDALEREAEFFNGTLPGEADDEESVAAASLESVKTDDAYTGEIVYDSNDEFESNDETSDASDDSEADETEEEEKSDGSDSETEDEQEESVADPCGPVVLCLFEDDEDSDDVDNETVERNESRSLEAASDYRRAPTTTRVSSRSTADMTPEAPAAAPIQDELWIVSQGGTYWLFENGSWNQKDAKRFFSEDDPRRVSIIWAHGYQTDMSSASRSGFNLKAVVDAARAATGVDRKYRIVIWKWESERNNSRLRLDAREKKDLAYYSGTKLGKFVGRMNPKDDVVFVGFSFGALVTGSALQTLATTSSSYMTGREKTAFATSGSEAASTPEVASGRISLILISAACDLGAFNQGGIFQSGATLPTRVLNVYNPTDYALKFYPLISGASQAIGIAPLMGNEFVNAVGETFNLNANAYLGKEHSFDDAIEYVSTTTLSDMIF